MLLPLVVCFRCKSGVAPAAAESSFTPAVFALTLAATFMPAIAALISSRWASKGGVYSPSNVIFTAVCVVIIVLGRMAVGYRSPLLEYLLWKDKQRLYVWFQTERQPAGYLAKLLLFQRVLLRRARPTTKPPSLRADGVKE